MEPSPSGLPPNLVHYSTKNTRNTRIQVQYTKDPNPNEGETPIQLSYTMTKEGPLIKKKKKRPLTIHLEDDKKPMSRKYLRWIRNRKRTTFVDVDKAPNLQRDYTMNYGNRNMSDLLNALGSAVGMVNYGGNFEAMPPKDRHVNKQHNMWYFIPSGVKSKELLKFQSSSWVRTYRESPRIPPRPIDPPQILEETIGSGAAKRGVLPGKKDRLVIVDTSSCYDMYNRPIIIRERDNTWHTPNWEERCQVHDSRRYIKRPYRAEQMVIFPDDHQPDKLAVANKPPSSFIVRFSDPMVNSLAQRKPPHYYDKYYDKMYPVEKSIAEDVRERMLKRNTREILTPELDELYHERRRQILFPHMLVG